MPKQPARPCYVATCGNVRPCPLHGQRVRMPQRRLYDRHAWRTAARQYLRAHPFCVTCRAARRVTLATEVDHVVPHEGDESRFWDRANWQALCSTCHGQKTKRERTQTQER